MKYALHATIPVVQYGNLRPVFEADEGESYEEFYTEAEKHVKEIWRKFGEKPLNDNDSGGEKITTFTGEEIVYNTGTHKYYDLQGNELLSGSGYADKHSPTFEMETILPKTAKAWDVDEDDLRKLWEMNSQVSQEYGSSIHTALEIYHKFGEMGAKIQESKGLDYNYCLPKNPYLRDIVLSFADKYGTDAEVELMVSDVANKMAGQIDRLEILDKKKKVCRVGDYKTNADLTDKKITKYQLQLSFYAHILKNHGWTVEGLDIYHFSDKWDKTELEVLDLIE